jgi:hypothetical protein
VNLGFALPPVDLQDRWWNVFPEGARALSKEMRFLAGLLISRSPCEILEPDAFADCRHGSFCNSSCGLAAPEVMSR